MPEATEVSVDEFLSKRKDFVKSGDILVKAHKQPASWNDERRSARFVMSSEMEDRDRDIIMQDGLSVDEFMKNPIALYGHFARGFPIGKWDNISTVRGNPRRTEGDLMFAPEGDDEVADRVARHVKSGILRATSIGFIPKRIRRREQEAEQGWSGYEILEADLMECSVVTVPSNPIALVKHADDFKDARLVIEEVLDTWAKHPETGLLVPREEFEEAYKLVPKNEPSLQQRLRQVEAEDKKRAAEEGQSVEDMTLVTDVDPSTLKEAASAFKKFNHGFEKFMKRLGVSFGEEPTPPKPADPERKAAALKRAAELEARISQMQH